MTDIQISLAMKNDEQKLLEFFRHYEIREVLENRIECYLSHNFTVVAKDKDKIVGTLQWFIREDPHMGVAEFEEIYLLEDYRSKGIGSLLIEFAIQYVKKYFKRIGIKPRRIILFTAKENKVARALYEKHGFRYVCDVGDLFADDEIELLYYLKL